MMRFQRRGHFAAHVMWLRSRPSFMRYEYTDSDRRRVESGTLDTGFARVKWTRYLMPPERALVLAPDSSRSIPPQPAVAVSVARLSGDA